MNIELKEYQETAVEQLTKSVGELLDGERVNSLCIFQSPTGSGKTVMVAKFIERLIAERDDDLCFLWLSVGKGDLHKQSKRSLAKIFDGAPRCVLVEEEFAGSRDIISQNTVVVVNWEKLWDKDREGNWKARLMRDGENVNFREVLENTGEKRKIVLIIDESHFASDTQRTNELREIIDADVTLEMSATPKVLTELELGVLQGQASGTTFRDGAGKFIYVKPDDVIAEGMIKKELIINEGIDDLFEENDDMTSERLILEAAFLKRLEQKAAFEAEGSNVNPLCLIQLPNADAGDEKRSRVEKFLKEKGITEDNEKLGIWLSGDKSDFLDRVSDNDNETEFLIFKQAIDTGWDCPRAAILVKLREPGNFTFEIQTVGRILRMPEWKHYETELLNVGNIYSNLVSIAVEHETYNPNIIKSLRAKRKSIYEPLGLRSYYKGRADYGDLTASFYPYFQKIFEDGLQLKRDFTLFDENRAIAERWGINFGAGDFQQLILSDVHMSTEKFDEISGQVEADRSDKLEVKLSDGDLFDVFNDVLRGKLNGFAPRRSIPTVRAAIYQTFKDYFGIDYRVDDGMIRIQRIFLANVENLAPIVGNATNEYRPVRRAEVVKKMTEDYYEWDVKPEEYYNKYVDEERMETAKYVYTKCYLKKTRSSIERDFETYLDSQESVLWWYKNADKGKDYFGIKYIDDNMPQTFYPDFIVQFGDGRVGIFDTKSGITAKTAGPRSVPQYT